VLNFITLVKEACVTKSSALEEKLRDAVVT